MKDGYGWLKIRTLYFQGLTGGDIGSLLRFTRIGNKRNLIVFLGLQRDEQLDTRD